MDQLVLVVLVFFLPDVELSVGDRSQSYLNCLGACERTNCSGDSLDVFYNVQPLHMRALLWSCEDECKYACMWNSVGKFVQNNAHVPQFYGKWPFFRWWGMQEPASVIFSLLNGLAHFFMWQHFKKTVPESAPMRTVWRAYAWISMHAWLWSTIFHTRDFPFTEKLDYFCATSGVLYCLFALTRRLLIQRPAVLSFACGLAYLTFFAYHVFYLTRVRFDYGYNMTVNIVIGVLNSVGWLLWSCTRWKHHSYTWRCAVTVLAVNMFLLLEVGDFPPLWGVFDAHSLWHLGTAPLPLLWYRFIEDDCMYLLNEKGLEEREAKSKLV